MCGARLTYLKIIQKLRFPYSYGTLILPGMSTTLAISEREPLAIVTVTIVKAVKFVPVVMLPSESIMKSGSLMLNV